MAAPSPRLPRRSTRQKHRNIRPATRRWPALFLLTILLAIPVPSPADDSLVFLRAVNHLLLSSGTCSIDYADNDPKYALSYQGLSFYEPLMPHTRYGLRQLTDKEFNRLPADARRQVADKLLASLFFGYPAPVLDKMLSSGNFLCTVRRGLFEDVNDMSRIEDEIRDDERYYHAEYANNEVYDILARFYAMSSLDNNYLHNWVAYILTQTILFSPAYELESTHDPDTASVYNWLVMDLDDDTGMRYSTYLHMTGLDNWRRFRSPEDNGREMMEIYTLNFNDSDVPRAATALRNWYLDDDGDTLVIGLDENTVPQPLFGTRVTTGFDFYRELVKSDRFISGSVRRLVDFFFTENDEASKVALTEKITVSGPETWQDILLQIVFSREYLLHTSRTKSAEELYYSLVKKLEYKHYRYSFRYLDQALEEMNQASMKYKLGKLERVPLDTLSFAAYHKFIREDILRVNVCGESEDRYDSWDSYGWRPQLIADDRFAYDADDPESSLNAFVDYLFRLLVHRSATPAEQDLFAGNMLTPDREEYQSRYNFRRVHDDGCYYWRENAAEDVMDYISRLSALYRFQEVTQ